jgi:hypothetical protein
MTRDEERQAWRTYAAAMVSVLRWPINDMADVATWADALLKEERQRFDGPDHSGDANKMVEPREWVDLTEAEIRQIVATWYPTQAELVRFTQDLLREKNGGTR